MLTLTSAYRQLSPTERAFVDGYVASLEREAARTHERLSLALQRPVEPAVVEASNGLLNRPMVTAAISERVAQIAQDEELSPRRIVKELIGMAFSSMAHFQTIGEDGMPVYDLTKATPEQMATIQAIEWEETYGRNGPQRKLKIKLHDKMAALDKLARYVGLFDDEHTHYRASTAQPTQDVLPASVGVEAAAERYARRIGG